jgi:hypothetical protein
MTGLAFLDYVGARSALNPWQRYIERNPQMVMVSGHG